MEKRKTPLWQELFLYAIAVFVVYAYIEHGGWLFFMQSVAIAIPVVWVWTWLEKRHARKKSLT